MRRVRDAKHAKCSAPSRRYRWRRRTAVLSSSPSAPAPLSHPRPIIDQDVNHRAHRPWTSQPPRQAPAPAAGPGRPERYLYPARFPRRAPTAAGRAHREPVSPAALDDLMAEELGAFDAGVKRPLMRVSSGRSGYVVASCLTCVVIRAPGRGRTGDHGSGWSIPTRDGCGSTG